MGLLLLSPDRVGVELYQIDITDDGSQVPYLADEDTLDMYDLYRIDFASAGVATTINSPHMFH